MRRLAGPPAVHGLWFGPCGVLVGIEEIFALLMGQLWSYVSVVRRITFPWRLYERDGFFSSPRAFITSLERESEIISKGWMSWLERSNNRTSEN